MNASILAAIVAVTSTGCGTLMLSPAYATAEDQRCVERALRRDPDRGVLAAARDRFAQACADGDPAGCSSLGVMYEEGLLVPEDEAAAIRLYRQACEGGNDAGCVHLGAAHLRGTALGRDPGRAAALFATGCESGHPGGCAELGILHLRGEGVAQNAVRGAELLSAACDHEPEACYRLAGAYEEGLLAVDPLRTLELYEKSCMGGIAPACDRMSERYSRRLPYEVTPELPEAQGRACKDGDEASCALSQRAR